MVAGEQFFEYMGLFDLFRKKKQIISYNNSTRSKEEIELFELAKTCVFRLSKEFKPLTPIGEAEALLFFSHIVVLLPELSNETLMDYMEERYMFLLCDSIKTKFLRDDFYDFANERVKFYEEQYEKVKREKLYTPMFIYNAFYMNPGCDNPGYLKEFNEPPTVLLILQSKLYELEMYIREERERIHYNYHFR